MSERATKAPGGPSLERSWSTAAPEDAQEVVAGRHRPVTDERTAVGGTDTRPDPYDLLLAALGSCTSMTVGLHAGRKQWPLEAVRVRLRHSKVHAADCEGDETRVGLIDRIERDVELVGPLDGDHRARLLDIANKCPVHRTLTSEIAIRTRLVPENPRWRPILHRTLIPRPSVSRPQTPPEFIR